MAAVADSNASLLLLRYSPEWEHSMLLCSKDVCCSKGAAGTMNSERSLRAKINNKVKPSEQPCSW